MLNRLALFSSSKSVRLTPISGVMSVMLIASFVFTVLPGAKAFTGLRTNGSSLVPAPDINFGWEVVCSGSGPTRTTVSRFRQKRNNSKSSNSKRSQQHQSGNPPSSSSSLLSSVSSMHTPFSSTLAMSESSLGSLPHSTSLASRTPSLSSSRSTSRPVTESLSGKPSPSVSARTAIAKVN